MKGLLPTRSLWHWTRVPNFFTSITFNLILESSYHETGNILICCQILYYLQQQQTWLKARVTVSTQRWKSRFQSRVKFSSQIIYLQLLTRREEFIVYISRHTLKRIFRLVFIQQWTSSYPLYISPSVSMGTTFGDQGVPDRCSRRGGAHVFIVNVSLGSKKMNKVGVPFICWRFVFPNQMTLE